MDGADRRVQRSRDAVASGRASYRELPERDHIRRRRQSLRCRLQPRRIWRVLRDSDAAEIWLSAPALAPTGAQDSGLVLPGANGVKLARGRVWVSNTSTSTLLSAPITRDGRPGELSVVFDHLFEIDDFQITPGGEIIAALNGASQVVSISPSGRIRVLDDAATGARNPSAVALSADGIYVTNAAFLTVGATLQRIAR